MAGKQRGFRKHTARKTGPIRKKHSRAYYLEQEILAHLYQKQKPQNIAEIMGALSLSRTERKMVSNLLGDMCRQGLVTCPRSKKAGKTYNLVQSDELVEGVVEVNPKGFGFAIIGNKPDQPGAQKDKSLRQDPFIAPDNLGSAHQGDRALFRLLPKKRGRMEAIVIKVLSRAATVLVGIYEAGRQTSLVIPEDERYLFNVLVRRKDSCGARNGDAVVVEITDFKAGQQNSVGRIIEVLGNPEDIGVQAEIVIRKHKLPYKFSDRALQEADGYPNAVPDDRNRSDLQDIPHVTIDGETAKDFDDAVAVEKTARGWRLYVSIADVSYYVRPGSALDREAYERGTSVYLPNRVVPMLPEQLSNNLCSLVPQVPRPAFTAILEFDRKGRRINKKFARSVISSHHRLTYTVVKKILADKDRELIDRYADIHEQLQEMAQLAAVLEEKRYKRGSIGFSIPEAEVIISGDQVEDVVRAERNMAHKIIEEFMLAANEAVAFTLSENNTSTLYRIHESPDEMKVREFTTFARTLGLAISKDGSGSPKWFGGVLTMVAGTPKEYIVNNILLRTMQRARYSPENKGHFGLAATHYTHFTSPIRRYPDLVVHRNLMGLLMSKKGSKSLPARDLEQEGEFLSGRERAAVDAEREMTERLQVHFMQDKIGETYEGIVSGVTGFGIFIELLEHFVSGGIRIEKLKDDYYHFEEKNYRLVGANSNRIFQVGQLVTVKVAGVDRRKRHIDFVLD